MEYVRIDTQSDPLSNTYPSTEKQKNLTRLIYDQLIQAGVSCETNEFGYVYAWLKSNSTKKVPSIFFCAHLDTAPDCSGTNVKPIIHLNYSGQTITLPDNPEIQISPIEYPELNDKIGKDIITASGLTLLGADDKAGVCAIMEGILYLLRNPELKHGDITILFTTDEEIGRGVDKVDPKKVNASFGYTFDSGDLGRFEEETFSADACSVEINGISTHPGYAKGKMKNAIKIASEIIDQLPKDFLTPESTDHKNGFIHPTRLHAELGFAKIDFILRDFITVNLDSHFEVIKQTCEHVIRKYPGAVYNIKRNEQYRNMKEVLDQHPKVSEFAMKAIEASGISLKQDIIRGGTDGSRLSFMGLPCPNIFAGEQAIHSLKEWVCVQDMQKASEVMVRICMLVEEESA